MTKKDATPFFKDYFAVGGKLKHVTLWLGEISDRYVEEKRKGHFRPEHDGFWDDVWDTVTDAVDTVGEAINTVVGAVVDAGKAFGEIVADVVAYAQRRINNIVEALLDAGKKVGELIAGAIEGAIGAIGDTLQKVVTAIVAAGRKALEIIQALYEDAKDYVRNGIKVLIKIGIRIRDILKAGVDLALDTLGDIVKQLVALGHSIWYILKRIANESFDVVKTVFGKLLEMGKKLADLAAWCVRRSFAVLKKGFQVLLALGYVAYDIVKTLLTEPSKLLKNALKALQELGSTIYDFLKAAAEFGVDSIKKVYETLLALGTKLADILVYAAKAGFAMFVDIAKWLLLAGVKVFDMLIWALDKTAEIFAWVMEAADAVFDSFIDIIVWAASFGDTPVARLAAWLGEKAKNAMDWFKDKVLLPVIEVGKLFLVILLAESNLVFLAVAYVALRALADPTQTDYLSWPKTFAGFKNKFQSKIANLTVSDSASYVVISDLHKESQEDVDGGIGHFYKNKELFKTVLQTYASDEKWTVVAVGDDEEFWYSNDLTGEGDEMQKVEPIISENADVYQLLSEEFYRNTSPRRFIKIRGNHDDVWMHSEAVGHLKKHGFPDLDIQDYAVISGQAKDILVMHGHQYDDHNCDANNAFGKFASNFVGESVDALNDTIVSIFGPDARIQGQDWSMFVAPFPTRAEWGAWFKDDSKWKSLKTDSDPVEDRLTQTMKDYDCSMIIGHTHVPRLLKDGSDHGRFYANPGTCGWWENCVLALEITKNDVTLKAWTNAASTGPVAPSKLKELSLAAAASF